MLSHAGFILPKMTHHVEIIFIFLDVMLVGSAVVDGAKTSVVIASTTTTTVSTTTTTVLPDKELWSCSFDGPDWCGMLQDRNATFNWTMYSGPSPDYIDKTGPPFGSRRDAFEVTAISHNYIMMSAMFQNAGASCRLITPTFQSETGCAVVAFWYLAYGSQMGVFNLRTGSLSTNHYSGYIWTTIFTYNVTSSEIPIWIYQEIGFRSGMRFQMVLEGIVGSGYSGDFAIDEIWINSTACQPTLNGSLVFFQDSSYNGQQSSSSTTTSSSNSGSKGGGTGSGPLATSIPIWAIVLIVLGCIFIIAGGLILGFMIYRNYQARHKYRATRLAVTAGSRQVDTRPKPPSALSIPPHDGSAEDAAVDTSLGVVSVTNELEQRAQITGQTLDEFGLPPLPTVAAEQTESEQKPQKKSSRRKGPLKRQINRKERAERRAERHAAKKRLKSGIVDRPLPVPPDAILKKMLGKAMTAPLPRRQIQRGVSRNPRTAAIVEEELASDLTWRTVISNNEQTGRRSATADDMELQDRGRAGKSSAIVEPIRQRSMTVSSVTHSDFNADESEESEDDLDEEDYSDEEEEEDEEDGDIFGNTAPAMKSSDPPLKTPVTPRTISTAIVNNPRAVGGGWEQSELGQGHVRRHSDVKVAEEPSSQKVTSQPVDRFQAGRRAIEAPKPVSSLASSSVMKAPGPSRPPKPPSKGLYDDLADDD